jgi:hypothetical protein
MHVTLWQFVDDDFAVRNNGLAGLRIMDLGFYAATQWETAPKGTCEWDSRQIFCFTGVLG